MSTPTVPLPNGHFASPHRTHPPSHLSNVVTSHYSHFKPPSRVDIHSVKQELHDALGEDGLPYWKALNGYLLGQVGRGEMEGMVRGWLKGSQVHLHNKLLVSLLHNASIPTHPLTPSSPMSMRKRKRVGPDDPEFDIDEVYVEPKARVHHWLMGINRKEGGRMKRAVMKQSEEGEKEDDGWGEKRKKLGIQQGNTMPPLAASARLLPSSNQLSHRLSQLAMAYDLTLSPDALSDIGEFLAIGMDAHLSDVLYALVHLVGRDRPGINTVRIPTGTKREEDVDVEIKTEHGEIPKADLEILRDLFTLNPSLHASTSPALYKLASNVTMAEAEYNSPPVKVERRSSPPPDVPMLGSLDKHEDRVNKLVEAGLVKIDNIKKDGEEGGKKDRKHNLHWKYEDPALILKSVLG